MLRGRPRKLSRPFALPSNRPESHPSANGSGDKQTANGQQPQNVVKECQATGCDNKLPCACWLQSGDRTFLPAGFPPPTSLAFVTGRLFSGGRLRISSTAGPKRA